MGRGNRGSCIERRGFALDGGVVYMYLYIEHALDRAQEAIRQNAEASKTLRPDKNGIVK